jgi:aryl-alcohol dehydrogenase-like predicted oxidoreductase
MRSAREAAMEKRILGKTGERLSVVGFGGIIVMDETPGDASAFVKEAIRRGINYFDVAPTYGNAIERLGPALEPYRKDVFLACKTTKRNGAEASAEIEKSLKGMRTDHFDLYQMHGVATMEEVDEILAPGGALEAFKEAKAKGLVRHLGFSAHSEEAALKLMGAFAFDSILFPVNYACWYEGGFGPRVLDAARKKGMGILALKALAKRARKKDEEREWPKCWYIPVDTKEDAALALRWTLSQQGVTAAVSPSHAELLWWMCDAVESFNPITARESEELKSAAKGLQPIFPH